MSKWFKFKLFTRTTWIFFALHSFKLKLNDFLVSLFLNCIQFEIIIDFEWLKPHLAAYKFLIIPITADKKIPRILRV